MFSTAIRQCTRHCLKVTEMTRTTRSLSILTRAHFVDPSSRFLSTTTSTPPTPTPPANAADSQEEQPTSTTTTSDASLVEVQEDAVETEDIISAITSTKITGDRPPLDPSDIASMSNEELEDTSTIAGWEFVHSPPRPSVPRGALVGTVVSDKMDKTVNVAVDRYRIVPKYRKRVRYTRKFMAHDEQQVANSGDVVMIVPCQKISKNKHFMLHEIIRKTGQL